MGKNKRGKVVSKRQSAAGKRRYGNIKAWTQAFMAARKALHVQGFHAVNGKSLQGKALYFKAKSFFKGGVQTEWVLLVQRCLAPLAPAPGVGMSTPVERQA